MFGISTCNFQNTASAYITPYFGSSSVIACAFVSFVSAFNVNGAVAKRSHGNPISGDGIKNSKNELTLEKTDCLALFPRRFSLAFELFFFCFPLASFSCAAKTFSLATVQSKHPKYRLHNMVCSVSFKHTISEYMVCVTCSASAKQSIYTCPTIYGHYCSFFLAQLLFAVEQIYCMSANSKQKQQAAIRVCCGHIRIIFIVYFWIYFYCLFVKSNNYFSNL